MQERQIIPGAVQVVLTGTGTSGTPAAVAAPAVIPALSGPMGWLLMSLMGLVGWVSVRRRFGP